MNLRFFRWLVPVAGTLLAGALLWGVYDRLQALETVNQALRERLSSLRSGSPTDVLIRRTELLSEGFRLDGTALRLSDERGDTVRLRDVLPDGGVVFRFSRLQCGLCVEAQMRLLQDLWPAGSVPLIVVSDFVSLRDMRVFRDLYRVDAPVFTLLSPWSLPAEDLSEPCFLRLDGDLRVRRVYIPRRDRPEETEAFFTALRREGK